MKVAHTIIMMILGIVLPLMVQLWDRRRLNAEQRGRSWNFATWGAALYAFGPASMLGWIFLTRPKGWRIIVAPAWTVPLILLLWLADGLLSWALQGEPFAIDPAELALGVVAIAAGSCAVMLVVELVVWLAGFWRSCRNRPAAR